MTNLPHEKLHRITNIGLTITMKNVNETAEVQNKTGSSSAYNSIISGHDALSYLRIFDRPQNYMKCVSSSRMLLIFVFFLL